MKFPFWQGEAGVACGFKHCLSSAHRTLSLSAGGAGRQHKAVPLPACQRSSANPQHPVSIHVPPQKGSVSGDSAGTKIFECRAPSASGEKRGLAWSVVREGVPAKARCKTTAARLWLWGSSLWFCGKRGVKEEIPLARLGWEWPCPSWATPPITAPV